MCSSIHLFIRTDGKNNLKSSVASCWQIRSSCGPKLRPGFSFVQRDGEGVPYPCHLSSAQVSVGLIVPLWEAPSTGQQEKKTLLVWCCDNFEYTHSFYLPAVDPGNVCESGLVPPTRLNVVAGQEDVGPDADSGHSTVVHRHTHQRTRSLRQVPEPRPGSNRWV